ncbi:dynein heavy chain [Sugiyamaella lignohabitans]|uniref:Dynein heavy chain, cytoplasmic n=1 Tax=Sugiyamaella lignohabitans TaxID=796027 RepID=A0A167FIR8_9ASCO|nr:dynein heavy chain [Sugiyamaella lignohabitans]ANB15355.1 dynein heavy chain [Sugiyamaella lignohabitans]
MNGIKVHQLRTSNKYSEEDFLFDLRGILKEAGCNGQKICFILDESNILETSFLERMNTLLANGEVPGLFEGDDYAALMTACKEGAMRQGLSLDSSDELYSWFTSEIVRNLHVVFTMNPPDSDLSSHITASPALFNRCVINWMGDWSDRTLYQLSSSLIEAIDVDKSDFIVPKTVKSCSLLLGIPNNFRETILHAVVYIHNCVRNIEKDIHGSVLANDVELTSGGKIMTTPGDFLDFVHHFVKIFKEKKDLLEDQQRHFNVGLDKIKGTVFKVRELRDGLAIKKAQLEQKSQEARDMLRQMVSDQNEAERKREASIEIQLALDIQEQEISKRQEVVLQDLALAEPAVLEAQKSVSNIKKQHLTELRSMGNPPEAVKLTLESVCVLLGQRTESWRDVQQYIRRDDFIASIVTFDNETQMTSQLRSYMENNYLSRPNYNFESVNRASKACGPLLQWVEAQVTYSSILEKVSPLRDEVTQLESEALQTKAQAQAISDMIEELEASIESYKDDYANLITETQTIKNEMAVVEHKVDRSVQLVDSLSAERKRWAESIKEFKDKNECLPGNSLLSAASIAYTGYFDQQVRNHLKNLWHIYLEDNGIRFEKSANLAENLTSGKQRLKWHNNSLPVDELYIENAIMIDRHSRYPFIIDPTGRIVEFLQKEHQSRKLIVTSFLNEAFVKHLESALRFGTPILIQDAEYTDPIIAQVLNKEYKKTGGRTLIDLNKQEIDFSNNFKLYLLTRDPSYIVPPHVSSRTTVINFTITRSSLENQTINMVLRTERPDIEKKRNELVRLQGEYKVHLRQLELDLLQALNNIEGDILDDDSIVGTLERVKVESSDVSRRIEETQFVMYEVESTMSEFQPLAAHSGRIFAVLEKLSLLNNYYQFSLNSFIDTIQAVLTAPTTVEKRVTQLVKGLYKEVYGRISHTLLKADKPLFVLLLIQLYGKGFDLDTFKSFRDLLAINSSTPGWLIRVGELTDAVKETVMTYDEKDIKEVVRAGHDVPDIWGESNTGEHAFN